MTRRRFIRISAAAAGLAVAPIGAVARADTGLVTWHGTLFGAVATLQIHHESRGEAERLVNAAAAEARRLERLFSLYRDDSALVELNRTGVLVDPDAELVELLERSRTYAELTDGLFDPTVQPLWRLYIEHFTRPDPDPSGPPPAALRAALDHVGYDRLSIGRDCITMPHGTAVTLNGIAQGYVTDKIVDLLRRQGLAHSLVDMGETRAIGPHADGSPWQVAIADPDAPGRAATVLSVIDRAVATSGAYGFRFDPQGRFNHLFDPRTGRCADRYRSVTSIAADTTAADALSKAFSFLPIEQIKALMPKAKIERVVTIDRAGVVADLVL